MVCAGTRAGQHYECCAEDSVEDISFFAERNLRVWLIIIPPAVDTVESVLGIALNIDRVSSTIGALVAEDVGEARIVTPDVLQEVLLLHLLHRQLDGPVLPLSILKQIFLTVKVPIELLASCVLLNHDIDNQHI